MPSKRVHALTGLRFVAALLVFVGHASWLVLNVNPYPITRSPIAHQRETGVGLFFALSGFVIAYTYGQRIIDEPNSARDFLWRRFARLYPMYLLAIVTIGVPLGFYLHDTNDLKALVEQIFVVNSWSRDGTAWYGWHGGVWTVSTEAFFYVMFPAFALLALRWIKSGWAAVGAWVAVWIVTLLWWAYCIHFAKRTLYTLYLFPPGRFLEFMLGALTAWALLNTDGRRLPFRLGPIAGLGLVVAWFTLSGQEVHPRLYPLVYVPLFSLVLYWLATEESLVSRFLSSPRLVLLGDASYSFYLVHIVGFFAARWTWEQFGGQPAGAGYLAYGVIFGLVVAVALSLGTFMLIERPAQRALLRIRPAQRPLSAGAEPAAP
jgi:peptidoglycan/LPS O-acetylase OafA/YrhL